MEFQLTVVFLAACSIFRGVLCDVVKGPSDATVLYGNNHEMNCDTEEGDQPGWDEIAGDGDIVQIFTLYERISMSEKYSNFNISGTVPVYNLTVTSIEIEDEGVYECSSTRVDGVRATLSVEAPAVSITIMCDTSNDCPAPNEDPASKVTCTCEAVGAYPRTLQLEWTGIEASTTLNVTPTSSGPTKSLDFMQEATGSISSTSGSITCTLTNYEVIGAERTAAYAYSSPTCVLEVENEDACTSGTATLVCRCTGASPNEITYRFFYEDFTVISGGDPKDNRRQGVSFTAGEETTFYCRGCNGFNFGKGSLGTARVCEKGTTASPTTSIEPSTTVTPPIVTITNPTPTDNHALPTELPTTTTKNDTKGGGNGGDGGNAVAIACGVVGGCLGVALVVILIVVIVKKREKGKGVNNDNTDGNGVNAKLAAEQPEYAAVNKPTSQPQAAPRSSQPPDKEEVELQYADLDHGKQGAPKEVRQPANEPTEYATVQSVIV